MKICSKCGEEKELKYFGLRKKSKDGRTPHCKNCRKEWDAKSYKKRSIAHKALVKARQQKILQDNHTRLASYLQEHPCVDCGNSDVRVLEFDHVRGNKSFGIATKMKCSWKVIEKEIEKCDVRCANCHRIVTGERSNSIRSKIKPVTSGGLVLS
jgi:hypothetical protein